MKRSRLTKSQSRRLSLGCERLENRRVLDASAMPIWDQMPEVKGQALTLDQGGSATANAQFGNFLYTTTNGAVTIIGYTASGGAVEIPAQIEGLPVTAIGVEAFSGRALTSVTIPSGVTSIGSSAFYSCISLTSVTIPASVTSIGISAFYGCTSLTSVTIPVGVTSISSKAFSNCTSLASVTIPLSVTSIGSEAFFYCTSLSGVTIPPSVKTIGSSAFSYCTSLRSVAIPSGVTSIGSYAFNGCTSLTSVTIPASVSTIDSSTFLLCRVLSSITVDTGSPAYASVDGVLYNKSVTQLIHYPAGRTGTVTIPAGVTSIGELAFYSSDSLTSVTIPSSVTSIGNSAFFDCVGLTDVHIPASVTSIGSSAFRHCTGLMSVTIPASVTGIGSSVFQDCTSLTSVTMQTGLTMIGNKTFFGCTSLLSVTIPASVTSIGSETFSGCTGLTSVTIPASVTSIGNEAFFGCTALTSLSMLTGLKIISGMAFSRCTGLTSVTIPASVTSIGYLAFSSCTSLTSVYFLGSPPFAGTTPFASSPVTVYRLSNASGWSATFGGKPVEIVQLVFADFTYSASNGAVTITGYTGVGGAVAIPAQVDGMPVTAIGARTFSEKTSVTSVTIPASVTSIGDEAFSGCTGLTSVSIPASVTSIGLGTFANCTSLTSVTIPAGVTSIYSNAFGNCTALKTALFLGNAPTISSRAFGSIPGIVYRLATSTGWNTTYDGVPVEIWEIVDVSAGQSTTATPFAQTSRVHKQGVGTAILNSASTRTGGTVVEAGEIVVRNKHALGFGVLDIGASTRVTIQLSQDFVNYESVTVMTLRFTDTARIELSTGGIAVIRNSLSEAEVRAKLVAGRNGGSWDGSAGFTSAQAGGISKRTLGYRMSEGSLQVSWAAPGDTNLDGAIDIIDIANILGGSRFNTAQPASWEHGDVNYDGIVDILDLSEIVSTNLFNRGSYLTLIWLGDGAAVDTGSVATFDSALVFAALAMDSSGPATTKRKSF